MDRGGAERVVLQLAEHAVASGDRVAVASAGGVWVKDLTAMGVEHHYVPLQRRSALGTLKAAAALRRAIRRERPDIVHTHNVGVTAATRPALATSRVRAGLLTTFHGVAPEDYKAAARALRWSSPRVVACSPAVGASLAAAGYPAGRIGVVTNAAGLEPAGEERLAAMRDRLGLDGRPLVVGFGRLAAQKAWPTLIEAAEGLEEADVVVAGAGPLQDELVAAAGASGSRVRFIGPVDDIPALVGLASCVVSTSTWEGLPLSVLESLSLGKPVVATSVDGLADIVSSDAVVLVPPGEPAAVREALRGVLADPGLARRLGDAGLRLAQNWTVDAMLAGYRREYAGVLPA